MWAYVLHVYATSKSQRAIRNQQRTQMDIAIVGLGKMGGNIARRLMRAGHRVVGYDRDEEVRQTLSDDGAEVVETMLDVVPKLEPPDRKSGVEGEGGADGG